MKIRDFYDIKYLHILCIVGIIGIYIVAAIGYIHDDVAYINLLGEEIEIGKCFYRENFGFECPSCGLTRSFVSIEEGNLLNSFRYNKVGFLVYILSFLVLIFNIMSLKKSRHAYKYGVFLAYFGVGIAILLAAFWLIRAFVLKDIFI